jgi:hypothetical protein
MCYVLGLFHQCAITPSASPTQIKKDRKQEFSGHQRISQSIQVSTPKLKHPPVLKAIKVCLRSVLDCTIFWIASQISEISPG